MSWLTRLALRNRSIVGLAVVGIVIVGAFGVTSLKEELIPDLTFPYLTVFTVAPGTSAGDVERSVTVPLEQVVKTTSGVKQYDSYSNDGMSVITIEYEFGTDMKTKEAEVQQAAAGVQQMLPQGAQPPDVAALNFATMPVVQLAVTSSLSPEQLAALLQEQVVPRLQAIEGVQAVTLSGVEQQQLQVRLKPKKVLELGVSPEQIVTAVQQANLTTGAGTVTSGSLVYPVTVKATAQTVAAFEALVIPLNGSTTATATTGGTATGPASSTGAPAAAASVTLGDIADVGVRAAPQTAVTRTNGEPSVGIAVSKSASGNTVDIANDVAAALPEITSDLGGRATITTVVDQSIYIKQSISSLLREGLVGAVFAVLVIWVFLRSWRSTFIAGVSIPLSVVGALALLWWRGESLNMLTLGGLTIAIGRVIDDSIVVIENAHRHLQEGDDVETAAYTATREVSGAITASTLTTVAVFLPLGFVHGLASEFFRPFAMTVTFALLASLLCALTVVPVLATWVLSKRQVGHREAQELTGLQRAYLPVLRVAIGHKLVTLIAAVAVFVAAMLATPLLKTNLFDNSAQNTMTVTQQMPAGTSLDATMAAAEGVEEVLGKTDGIDIYQVTAGSTGSLFGAGGVNASASQAVFTITTDPDMEKSAIIEDVRAGVAGLPEGAGVVTVSGEDSSTGGGMTGIEVRVSADDPAVLKAANQKVLQAVEGVEGLADVTSNLSEGRAGITVQIDQAKATAAGVDASTLSQYTTLILNGFTLGTVPTPDGVLPAQLTVGDVTLPPIPGAVSMLLTRLPVPTAGGMVPMSEVATIRQITAPVQVTHVDGKRTATVSAAVVNNNIGAASTATQEALDKVKMPSGATWELAGATEMTSDVFRTLGIAMAIAILLVYIIMVATFRSLLNPLILLVSIPFAAVGAVILLLVTGTSLGMPGLIGLLMLIGIVVTNAIVLLDLIEQFRRAGMDARTAVIEGGRRRLRPILMTAIATILALVPMALGLGEGAFLSTPLAVVVIGGLFTSTILTLILVPVLYLALDRLRPKRGRRAELGGRDTTGGARPDTVGRRVGCAATADERSDRAEDPIEEDHRQGRRPGPQGGRQGRCRTARGAAAQRRQGRARRPAQQGPRQGVLGADPVRTARRRHDGPGVRRDLGRAHGALQRGAPARHRAVGPDRLPRRGARRGRRRDLRLRGLQDDARAGPRRRTRRDRPLQGAHRPGRDAPGVRPAPRPRGHPDHRGRARPRPAERAEPVRSGGGGAQRRPRRPPSRARQPPAALALVGARLHFVHARVLAVEGHELVVRAALDDAPFVDDVDAVGVAHRREAVADEDHGTTPRQLADVLEDAPLRHRVEGAGRLVEHEHVGVAHEGARQRHLLPLADRELLAVLEPLAQHRVVAGAQPLDDLVRAGLTRPPAPPPGRPRAAARCPSRCSGAPTAGTGRSPGR